MANFVLRVPAIRGHQGHRDFYQTVIPFDTVSKVFRFNEDDLDLAPEDRVQRKVNQARIPEIAAYITENDDWVFSAITVSVDGDLRFIPISKDSQDVGFIEVNLNATFIINDGQHRRAGIIEALKTKPELANEGLPVVLFRYEGTDRCQQMFADLNRHAQKPTKSINILFDARDPFGQLVAECEQRVEVLRGSIEKEKVSLALKSPKLFTLSTVYEATKTVIGKVGDDSVVTDDDLQTAVEFWETAEKAIPEWLDAKNPRETGVRPIDIRAEYVFGHGIGVLGIAGVARAALEYSPNDWTPYVLKLRNVDWRRANRDWEGVCMNAGRIIGNRTSLTLTTAYLKQQVGLPLSAKEQALWDELDSQQQVAASSEDHDD